MKTVYLVNADKTHARVIGVSSIVKGKGRETLLREFARNPDLRYVETNERRYTVSDIYAGRSGQAIQR